MKIRRETGQYQKELIYSYVRPYIIIDMPAVIRNDNNVSELQSKREIRNNTRNDIRRNLIAIFSKVINKPVDLYIETILSKIDNKTFSIPDDHLQKIRDRLGRRQLADVDVDHLLLLTMELVQGTGFNPVVNNIKLVEPRYHAAVFIDEVQDFTEIQVRLMSMLANPKIERLLWSAIWDSGYIVRVFQTLHPVL